MANGFIHGCWVYGNSARVCEDGTKGCVRKHQTHTLEGWMSPADTERAACRQADQWEKERARSKAFRPVPSDMTKRERLIRRLLETAYTTRAAEHYLHLYAGAIPR